MKIIVMADSHGDEMALKKIFDKTYDSGDIFVHLGDGLNDLLRIRAQFPKLDIRTVTGNCDYGSQAPMFIIIPSIQGNIYIAHGHMLRVNYGIDFIRRTAAGYNCKLVMFAHTHCRLQQFDHNMYFFNPGSCSRPRDFTAPSFGTVDITDAGIITNIIEIDH